jgi:hypothetical protein
MNPMFSVLLSLPDWTRVARVTLSNFANMECNHCKHKKWKSRWDGRGCGRLHTLSYAHLRSHIRMHTSQDSTGSTIGNAAAKTSRTASTDTPSPSGRSLLASHLSKATRIMLCGADSAWNPTNHTSIHLQRLSSPLPRFKHVKNLLQLLIQSNTLMSEPGVVRYGDVP